MSDKERDENAEMKRKCKDLPTFHEERVQKAIEEAQKAREARDKNQQE